MKERYSEIIGWQDDGRKENRSRDGSGERRHIDAQD